MQRARHPYPRFTGLTPASEASSRAKRANPSSETATELRLRRELWRRGLRYRKDVRTVTGRPDLMFRRAGVVVFCDGDFWHGRDWRSLRLRLTRHANSDYWVAKIRRNMQRDEQVTALLRRQGWRVIRLWETDIHRQLHRVAGYIRRVVRSRQTLEKMASKTSPSYPRRDRDH